MKKVSILALHLGYGGIEKSIVALCNLLCERYEVEIACSYRLYDTCVFPLDSRVKVKYLIPDLRPNRVEFMDAWRHKKLFAFINEGRKGIHVLWMRRRSMIRYIKNCSSDVIISTRDIFNDWLGEYGSDQALKIGWEHNHYHNDLKYAGNITKSVWKLDYLVLVSLSLQKFYQKELRKSKCRCIFIPNIIEKIPTKVAPLKKERFISIGRLSPEKGQLDLLKIYALLEKKYPNWTLDLIGDGEERSCLEQFIREHHLEEKIHLHGFRDKEYIDKMLHDSSIYIMTSFTESFGIVLIEAMSHGVPCVAFSSAEGARELIVSGKNGYLIKNRNYRAMIKKLSDLVEHPDERKRIGKAARGSVKKYTGDVVSKEWFELIEKRR